MELFSSFKISKIKSTFKSINLFNYWVLVDNIKSDLKNYKIN